MATKRKKVPVWEFTVRRRDVLPKPIYLRFFNEAGDEYVRRLEAQLDSGVIPVGIDERARIE